MTEQAPTAPGVPTSNPIALFVGLIAGVLMVVGGVFLDLVSGFPSKATDSGADIFWSVTPADQPSFFASAAFVILVIAAITLLGAATSRGGWLVFGGILAVAAFVLVMISFYRVEGADLGIGDAGMGLWTILVGGVLAIVAGSTSRRTT
jgi:hypothetical protein